MPTLTNNLNRGNFSFYVAGEYYLQRLLLWQFQVANHLNVSKPRVQAIIRNIQYGDQSDADARFDMLMTWLKKTPKAVDKVLNNLLPAQQKIKAVKVIRKRTKH